MKQFNYYLACLAAICLISFQSAFAQPQMIEKVEPSKDKTVIPFEKWKLTNGLTILIGEDHSDPIVNVSVTYHVGSARESIGKSGFAHFFEHMMFEGSDHVKDKEHIKIVSAAGGNMNGFTQRDKTVYFETMPSNDLELALWLEADRMGFLLDSVTKERFENQRSTVKNEKGQNVENQPYGLTEEVLDQILYPAGHPYNWPVIGYVDDLDRVTVDDLKNFFLRWYGPNNAILTVTGDVTPKDVVALADKYFGTINPCPEVKRMKFPAPNLSSDQYTNYVDNVFQPLTMMVYPTVPEYHRDEPAIDIMASMMGEGNNSVFYKHFVKTEKGEAGVSHQSSELSGELQMYVLAFPEFEMDIAGSLQKSFNETEQEIHKTVDDFEQNGITDEALQRAKAKKESQLIEQLTTVFGKGMMLTEWQLMMDRPFNFQDELDRYNKVTKEDIQRVFAKYVKDKHAAIVNVYPKDPMSKDSVKVQSENPNAKVIPANDPQYAGLKYVKAKDSFDRGIRPVPGPQKTVTVPQYYTKQLPNGLKMIGTQDNEAPEVVITLTINDGDLVFSADPKKVGLAELTAYMMEEGTQNYTSEQISAELEKLGSTISFNASMENTSVTVNTLTKNLDATLKLLEEKLYRPRFDADDFKRVKKQYIQTLWSDKKQAQAVAGKLYRNLVYGNTILGTYVSDKNVKKFTLDDVKNYYKQYYSPSVTNVVIVGNVSEGEILPKLDFLSKWEAKAVTLPEVSGFPVQQQTQIYLVHKDGAPQSVIMVGNLAMPFDATGEYYKSNIMNYPFGGSFNSRLNLNLREQKGVTYGIYSGFSGTTYPGSFTISTSVRKSATDTSVAEIMKELKDFKAKGITNEEYDYTKSSLLNYDALKYESPFQKAGFLSRVVKYNLPKDFTVAQADILKKISKDDINGLIQKNINPDKMIILVVGNKYIVKDKLEKLGYGKVKEVQLD
jgi:zinc protease